MPRTPRPEPTPPEEHPADRWWRGTVPDLPSSPLLPPAEWNDTAPPESQSAENTLRIEVDAIRRMADQDRMDNLARRAEEIRRVRVEPEPTGLAGPAPNESAADRRRRESREVIRRMEQSMASRATGLAQPTEYTITLENRGMGITGALQAAPQRQLDPEEEEIPSNRGEQRAGPRILAAASNPVNGTMCQTCANWFPENTMLRTADDIRVCGRCLGMFNRCQYCHYTAPVEKFEIRVFAHLACSDCSNASGKRLNIKQHVECKPKTNILVSRKGKVWVTSSPSGPTPKD